ncbi:protein phosphatase 1 regulatory inhibitor subunit 16B [Rana temporaria]|uniref:protein phosphatase 1 regulatory inhibitor subunit 16B n=1 Tax=Rana temporaria TaxID=8407 RepID=UPI001AADA485|nr:protein phosphatase 1 regulatory inhibitor subunit 16B [Rana temporaria]XP_040186384.1 protein phosphatase 1 regulatory inhibitor subunit 16B [Rana temporaria]
MATKPMDLLAELQLLEKASTLERLRAAKKRREQQLKRWVQNEREEDNRRRRQQKSRRKTPTRSKRVSFPCRVTLHEACLRNDPEEVLVLLKSNVDPNLSNEDGLTALHQCCIDNYEDLLKLLLSHGANVNVTDNELWTPLHAAATCGHTNLVRILIQHGADLLAVNADGNMVYDLCEEDATLNVIENFMTYKGVTQEMVNEARQAPERHMLNDIGALVAAGQDLNRTDNQGATLLHIASSRGYAEVAETLLENGAQVDVKDPDMWEPLHAAAFWGQIYVAEILVSHGASLSCRTSLDETPLDLCEDEELRSLLLELKHKHDLIMKSQQKNKSSLSRRSSSTGSHGKVVRRASLSERTNMYRREYEKEAVVWQCLVSAEAEGAQEDEESSPDLQRSKPLDPDTVRGNHNDFSEVQYHNGYCSPVPPFYCSQIIPDSQVPTPISNGSSNYSLSSYTQSPVWSSILDQAPITLSELKRQRMAAKQSRYLARSTSELLGSGNVDYGSDPGTPPWCSNGTPVYYTPTSGDPPILRLKATSEEEEEEASKILRCCRLS